MAALDFYFDYRSPYAYLAQTQVRKLGVEIAWRPFEILAADGSGRQRADQHHLQAQGQVPGRGPHAVGGDVQGSVPAPSPGGRASTPAGCCARRWRRRSSARRTRRSGRSSGPTGDPARRSRPPDDVVAVLSGAGVSGPDLAARIDDPALDAALDAATDEAAARGVFGAPTMYVGDEMFFGNDRFDFVRASLGVAA